LLELAGRSFRWCCLLERKEQENRDREEEREIVRKEKINVKKYVQIKISKREPT
jgi:hypothetical protein